MAYIKSVLSIVHKDVMIELRAKEAVTAMLLFGVLVILIFSFAFTTELQGQKAIAPGLLWIAFTFGGMLGLNHSFSTEHENNCIHGLMLSPAPRSVIYVGKLISNVIFMMVAEIIVLIIFLWLFEVRFTGRWHYLFITLVLGTIGFAATGTIFSAISAGLRMRVFVLPILQFPITAPVVIAAVEATAALLTEELTGYYDWLKILAVFDLIFISVCVMLFEYILEE